ncbi:hypothetical protein V0288_09360 [Pannus brasiliensis CCIBt3594]|uniref:Uncharacterized protein n=1 Tax=Pannus brasiliensis CCIBt3594 TaxID=1427578 RepID=A0AAW9QHP1_9CHRO
MSIYLLIQQRRIYFGHFPMKIANRIVLFSLALGLGLGTMTKPSRADHSLATAMQQNATIAEEVARLTEAHDVLCDVENSNQTYYYPAERGRSGTAWKQIALCFKDEADMKKAREYFQQGGDLGFYGAPGVVGVLVVAYTWEGYGAGRILSLEYL